MTEVFDPGKPGEDRAFYRFVNLVHVRTREGVIRRELLFREGDTLDRKLLAETERNLRARSFLRSAEITASIRAVSATGKPCDRSDAAGAFAAAAGTDSVSGPDSVADIVVHVQDNWTTRASYKLSRAGGNNSGAIALQERNLFGRGKRLEFRFESNQDRSRNTFEYEDPQLFGTRFHFDAAHQVSSDGSGNRFEIERPFFSEDSRWSAGAVASDGNETLKIYQDGEVIGRFDKQLRSGDVFAGFSPGVRDGLIHRYIFDWSYDRTIYTPTETLPKDYPRQQLPQNRTVSGPAFTWHRERSDWINRRNIIRIERTEDFNLGSVIEVEPGLDGRAFGGFANELLLNAEISRGFRIGEHGFLLNRNLLSSRLGQGEGNQALVTSIATWYDNRFRHQTLVAHARIDSGHSLSAAARLLLGGDEGLRGFDSRILSGDKRFIVNLEDRYWTRRELLHLFFVGAAAFVDAGNAWGGPGASGFGQVHTDAGIGLRLDASRASHGGLLRLDLAVPVTGDRAGGPAIQFTFGHSLGF